jgi:Transposase DDE domain group 1
MGESQKQPFQLSFNRFLRVGFQGSKMTSNGGLILVRELDERLGFGELIEEHLTDSRANNARFPLADLLRQSVYSRVAGYEDVNDAERLSQDPTFRLIGSEKLWDRGAAASVGIARTTAPEKIDFDPPQESRSVRRSWL